MDVPAGDKEADEITAVVEEASKTSGNIPEETTQEKSSAVKSAADEEFADIAKYNIFDICGTDKLGRPVLVVNACKLPTYGELDFDRFLKYFTYTLDKVVEKEYILIYFHHGLIPGNRPPFSWIRQVYMQFSRKYKKNLKMCYIVHPTTLIKVIINLLRPLISVKFGRKIRYVNHLSGIADVVQLDQIPIPSIVTEYDKTLPDKSAAIIHYENGSSENGVETTPE